MNKPSNTPVATIIVIILLGVIVLGCLVGGVLMGAGWFLFESAPEPLPSGEPLPTPGQY